MQGLNADKPWLGALIRVLLFVVPILLLVPGLIWWERRLLSWMQDRIGPNRVATFTLKSGKKIKLFGLLQPIADGVKLFFKEDITPTAVDRLIYFLAPAMALFPAFAIGAVIPFGPQTGIWQYLTPISNASIGILYVLAISSLGVYGVVLAGYASNNKYSLMGGLRAAAQLISYELAMGMALASIVIATGSLRMTDMQTAQEGPLWGMVPFVQNWFILTPFGFVAAVIFAICVIAETNRAPFDLPEAENELIAGYHTEYSSMKFAVFFMGEYAAMFLLSGVFAVVFLGGYNILPFQVLQPVSAMVAPLVFLGKCAAGITFFIWLRATLPRLRYDQLMSLGWRSLLPLAVANFVTVGLWVLYSSKDGQQTPALAMGAWVVAAVILVALYMIVVKKWSSARLNSMEKRTITLVSGSPVTAPITAEVKELAVEG